ncbi:MAG: hypothetical protein IPF99_43425 [Deltaproteobacteria bacterium]|nr:hypothetical protein [Deltaproteobacteria bacterium]
MQLSSGALRLFSSIPRSTGRLLLQASMRRGEFDDGARLLMEGLDGLLDPRARLRRIERPAPLGLRRAATPQGVPPDHPR